MRFPRRIVGSGWSVSISVAAALFAFVTPALVAQCAPIWVSGGGAPGVSSGSVSALTAWDPDGAGPLGEHVVAGGSSRIERRCPKYIKIYQKYVKKSKKVFNFFRKIDF